LTLSKPSEKGFFPSSSNNLYWEQSFLRKPPLPPPAFGCAFIPDFAPESIGKARQEALTDLEKVRFL
jgi:hypothetical protein